LKAFYVSPFSEEHWWVRHAVAAACREHDVELRAVDETVQPGANIINAIHQEINECDFAFAVLTDGNPNVFYELGRLLQASKPTILLVNKSKLSALPFDVKAFSVLAYEADEKVLINSVGSAIGKVKLALNPITREPRISAQAISAKTLIIAYHDFEKIRKDAEGMMGNHDCESVDIKNYDTDSFKGWNQILECPNGDVIVVVIDLNGDIVRVRKK